MPAPRQVKRLPAQHTVTFSTGYQSEAVLTSLYNVFYFFAFMFASARVCVCDFTYTLRLDSSFYEIQ